MLFKLDLQLKRRFPFTSRRGNDPEAKKAMEAELKAKGTKKANEEELKAKKAKEAKEAMLIELKATKAKKAIES
ncbi:hypothetical protein Tco_0722773 [Tanacetum coccineum]